MKACVSFVFILAVVSFSLAFIPAPRPVQMNGATVSQMGGLYMFVESQPTAPYDVMGTVKKTGVSWSGGATEIANIMIKRANKDYPGCQGLIFDDISLEHATVIKFK